VVKQQRSGNVPVSGPLLMIDLVEFSGVNLHGDLQL
jgi:hypothetical protein